MITGSRATFVITWAQTETEGLRAAMPAAVTVGASWRWSGEALRIDAPGNLLILTGAEGETDVRRRAALMVQRLIGIAVSDEAPAGAPASAPEAEALPDQSFVVSDGRNSWTATILPLAPTLSSTPTGARGRLLMFLGEMPPEGRELWVVASRVARDIPAAASTAGGLLPGAPGPAGGVICFTPGTRIRIPQGEALIEDLHPGDLVQTRDNGPQQVLWTGSRRMSGARLYAMPHLRPIRISAGALGRDGSAGPGGAGRPDGDLLVSPQHRMLVTGPAALALFNSDEVLVAAEDLVNDHSIRADLSCREVTYHHLLLERHEILFANGAGTESFHPSAADPEALSAGDHARLLALLPRLATDPGSYGDFARRNLSPAEAALLRHPGRGGRPAAHLLTAGRAG